MSTDYAALADEYAEEIMEADPELAGMRAARAEEERRRQHIERELPSSRRMSFSNAHLDTDRTITDIERELQAIGEGGNLRQWLRYGPFSWGYVTDRPEQYRDIIDAWKARDMARYERLLRERGLVR